jgi:hypothetical protein
MTDEPQISVKGQLRRRMMDATFDLWTDATPTQLEPLCRMMESLARRVREASATGVGTALTTDGNITALPGVELEAARRAQRRTRKGARS